VYEANKALIAASLDKGSASFHGIHRNDRCAPIGKADSRPAIKIAKAWVGNDVVQDPHELTARQQGRNRADNKGLLRVCHQYVKRVRKPR
jgi:hypothetical protein